MLILLFKTYYENLYFHGIDNDDILTQNSFLFLFYVISEFRSPIAMETPCLSHYTVFQ